MSREDLIRKVSEAVEKRRNEIIDFVRELVKTPSLSGQEKDVAELMRSKMVSEGFKRAVIDELGNVYGVVGEGRGGNTLIYNGHMDTVPPGGMEDPYSAKILDGKEFGVEGPVIYGRGSSDMKGSLGAMLMAGAIINELDINLTGELIVSGTVLEEVPGTIGPHALFDKDGLRADAAVVGECTDLNVAYGHRGAIRTRLSTYGKSCHISVQERGVNALYKMVKVIEEIEKLNSTLPSHPILGKSTWGVAKINVRPNIVNVVPDLCTVDIDTRNTPNFPVEDILKRQREIIDKLASEDPEFKADVHLIEHELVCWTGHKEVVKAICNPFYTDPNSWIVKTAKNSIREITGEEPKAIVWNFGTESWCFKMRGISTIGFGVGEERFTHSNNEVLSIEDLIKATKIYTWLAINICGVET